MVCVKNSTNRTLQFVNTGLQLAVFRLFRVALLKSLSLKRGRSGLTAGTYFLSLVLISFALKRAHPTDPVMTVAAIISNTALIPTEATM